MSKETSTTGHIDLAVQAAFILLKLNAVCELIIAEARAIECCRDAARAMEGEYCRDAVEGESWINSGEGSSEGGWAVQSGGYGSDDDSTDGGMMMQGWGHGEEVTRRFDMVRIVWDLQSSN